MKIRTDAGSVLEPKVAETLKSKQNIKIYLHNEASSLSKERRLAAIAAFASIMDISPEEIEVYAIYEGELVFDLGVPAKGVERLHTHIQANNSQLRLLSVKAALIERASGKIESWMLRGGKFEMDAFLDPVAPDDVSRSFAPIPGIWRFHLIYLFVTLALGAAIFPFSQFISVLLISAVCAFGVILAFSKTVNGGSSFSRSYWLGYADCCICQLAPGTDRNFVSPFDFWDYNGP